MAAVQVAQAVLLALLAEEVLLAVVALSVVDPLAVAALLVVVALSAAALLVVVALSADAKTGNNLYKKHGFYIRAFSFYTHGAVSQA
ncbi:hypothetical protein IKG10_02785 [Candidatus Saccharibacteria bacterium]|nr:hypothetical protein [Candidatus Saccharibacteria bacterium]